MKTFLLSTAAVFLVYLVGSWYVVDDTAPEDQPYFRTLAVTQDDLLIAVAATGTIEPVEVVDVGAQILGRIESFGPDPRREGKTVDYGSTVDAGMIIAQIDDATYQAEMANAQANLKLAEAEVVKLQSVLAQAERDFKRAERLRNTSPEAEYERALAALETARADVDVGLAKIEQAKAAMRQAEINLGYTVIRSPIDGIVIDRRVNVGQTVIAGLDAPSLFLIAKNLEQMQVWAAVNEADIGQIYTGQKVTFRVDAYREQLFTGKVSQIRLNASMTHNVVTYGVIVQVDNPDGKLLPYMTANLQFEVDRRDQVRLVPNQALRWKPSLELVAPDAREEAAQYLTGSAGNNGTSSAGSETAPAVVWVKVNKDLVRPIPVTTGLSDGNVTEIVSGELEAGQEVVITRVQPLKGDFASTFLSRITGPSYEEEKAAEPDTKNDGKSNQE